MASFVGQKHVGKRVRVFWEGDDNWFQGRVGDFDPLNDDKRCFLVVYDDGTQEWEAFEDLHFLTQENRCSVLDYCEHAHHQEENRALQSFNECVANKSIKTSAILESPWVFVDDSDCGKGLFARTALKAEQAICEYNGPRLPLKLLPGGEYVLQLPGGQGIDGDCTNSPFELPRWPAIYCNHSARPNARIEYWPALQCDPHDVHGNMWVVTTEEIAPGREIRVDYERGRCGTYWHGKPPAETAWREHFVRPPEKLPSGTAAAATHVLQHILDAQAAGTCLLGHLRQHLLCTVNQPSKLPWAGLTGGAARLRLLVPLLLPPSGSSQRAWGLIATHLPGRSAMECKVQWGKLQVSARNPAPQPPASVDMLSDLDLEEAVSVWMQKHQAAWGYKRKPWVPPEATPATESTSTDTLGEPVRGLVPARSKADAIKPRDNPPSKEEILAQAQREYLVLVPGSGATGYKHVHCARGYYVARDSDGEKLGSFRSAAEAALAFARHLGPEASHEAVACFEAHVPLKDRRKRLKSTYKAMPVISAKVKQVVDAEGLTLVPALRQSNKTGFAGVSYHVTMGKYAAIKPESPTSRSGRSLGFFDTADEAALAYARHLGPEMSAKHAHPDFVPTAKRKPSRRVHELTRSPTDTEIEEKAKAEGLTLVRTIRTKTGFAGVHQCQRRDADGLGDFKAHGPARKYLGTFWTAAEAALAYARHLGPQGSASAAAATAKAELPSPTEEEVRRVAALEGLTIVANPRRHSATKFQHVAKTACGRFQAWDYSPNHQGGKKSTVRISLGCFRTAHEAALCYARHLGSAGSAHAAAHIHTRWGDTPRAKCGRFTGIASCAEGRAEDEDADDDNDDGINMEEDHGEDAEDGEELSSRVGLARPQPPKRRRGTTDELIASAQRSRLGRVSRGETQGGQWSDATFSPLRPPIGARISVLWLDDIWYTGTVIDADVELARRGEQRYRFRVSYDDGTVTWHCEAEEPVKLLATA